METARDLFVHEITDLLDAEQKLVKALGELERDSKHSGLKNGFGEHKRQTEQHVKRLQQVFQKIGEKPQTTECKGIKGLIDERETFKKEEEPSSDILDIFDCGAGIKAETYEICSYNSVISLAEQLDMEEVIDLLQQNLSDEEEALEKLQDIQEELEPEELGVEAADDDDDEDEDEDEDDEDLEDDEDDEEAEDEGPAKRASKKPAKTPQKGKSKRVA